MLEIDNVTMRFGGLKAVKDVSLTVAAGDLAGLIGPNGAGKTTLFNVVCGQLRPSAGRVLFEGRDVTGWKPHRSIRLGLGRTFQITRPFGRLSLLDNVVIGAMCREKSLDRARQAALGRLAQVGLADRAQDTAQNLPLGLRKKLELARILATRPRMLLLDEVMGGLGPREIEEMSRTISQIHGEGVSIVLIEHVMPAVMSLCQRIAVINHGELIAVGSPQDIRADRRVIKAYLGESVAGDSPGGQGSAAASQTAAQAAAQATTASSATEA
ncbi:MAG: ABC transporter ATP-binding protein [Deltaproteobacteria bacterium]|jgi:branched-chain amino acid transport system ATP-binding protein|nr:ABC transporter ATP-binding protein [Deltaproteobacteria bacterium]